ncbi:hypothetical protein GSI_12090 [Ganoderma sinense ZZ0214-1]|uniref:F-box domain-containing protein n=1 Tax=Ganoderma sinense ZZ0214-1 TaxID=1077348 RepID=A0A2G8RXW3_9APHY|nr:hypothetical protein GSI_12090 [Ganoderma sinense ZZ0214-1]
MIFQAWKDLCETKRHGIGAEWVRATWVCKTWREVAFQAATLWSAVLVSRPLADDPPLSIQLDRTRGVALDLSISGGRMSEAELEEVFSFVLSKRNAVKQLQITFEVEQLLTIKGFVQGVGAEIVTLSLSLNCIQDGSDYTGGWKFTPDLFPRLRHLALDKLTPTPSAPLLTLTRLDLVDVYDEDHSNLVHRFLACFPNLENLRVEWCFVDLGEDTGSEPPIVELPKLRYLSVKDTAFDIWAALSSLRLPSLSSFHVLAECDGDVDDDFILPGNITPSFPFIRHTRCLSLTVGQPTTHLSFRGSLGDTLEDGPDWSITMPDPTLEPPKSDPDLYPAFLSADLRLAKFYWLGYNARRIITHIPHLVDPSLTVELQLHFAHGLPVVRDWARFFGAMPRLRTLGIGGGTLATAILEAFRADPGLCAELQDVALCAITSPGATRMEKGIPSFFMKAVGSWLRKRADVGTRLQSLTVRTSSDGSGSQSGDRGALARPEAKGKARADSEPVGFAAKLRWDLERLGDLVGKVVVEDADCPACSMKHKLLADPPKLADSEELASDGGRGDHDDPYFF